MRTEIQVAMLIHNYLPALGGAERQLAALIPRLATHGVAARVITRSYPGTPTHEILDGADVTRLQVDSVPRAGSILYTRQALGDLKNRRVDLVHAHSLLSPATTAVLAKRRFGIPALAKVLRGGSLGDLVDLRRKGIGDIRFRWLNAGLNGFVAISHEIEGELASHGVPEARRWFIPNGVDTHRFRPQDSGAKPTLRGNLGLHGEPLVVFAGRLAAEKGLHRLLQAWGAVRTRHPAAGLAILGSGPEEASLRRNAPNGVQFVGMVDDVAPYFAAADVFVLPSDAEGLSNALLEAMAANLPPIVTAVGGAIDIVDSTTGWLIPVQDVDALRAALDEALSHPAQLRAKAEAARRVVKQTYGLDVVSARLAELYRMLVG